MAAKPKTIASRAWSWIGPGGNWKWVLGALTALAILAYVVSLRLNLAAEKAGRAEDARQVAEATTTALQTASTGRTAANETRSSARRSITAETEQKRKQLDDALAANQDWANQPVPRAVADSLR